jgi:hypothetical protein
MLGKHPKFRKPQLVKRWHFTCRKVLDQTDCRKEKRYNHSRETRVATGFQNTMDKTKGRNAAMEIYAFCCYVGLGVNRRVRLPGPYRGR